MPAAILSERQVAAAVEPGVAGQRLFARRRRVARRSHHAIGDGFDEQVAPGGMIVGVGSRLVDVEQDLRFGLGDGQVAVAADSCR